MILPTAEKLCSSLASAYSQSQLASLINFTQHNIIWEKSPLRNCLDQTDQQACPPGIILSVNWYGRTSVSGTLPQHEVLRCIRKLKEWNAISCNQAKEGWELQPSHKTFGPQCPLLLRGTGVESEQKQKEWPTNIWPNLSSLPRERTHPWHY